MREPVYRTAPPEALCSVTVDAFTAIYHRESGLTHLVTAPAPEIMALLAGNGLTLAALRAALFAHYDLLDDDTAALAARLDELVATGLVAAA